MFAPPSNGQRTARRSPWVRAKSGILGGVLQGWAESWRLSPWILRGSFSLLALFYGVGLWIYVVALLTLPREGQYQGPRFLGVCQAWSERWQVPVGMLRFCFVCLLMATGGLALMPYVYARFRTESRLYPF